MASLLGNPTLGDISDQKAQEFDFGPILARGKTLRHEFTLANPSKHPIRLLGASTSTPCCSAIGPLPKAVSPGAKIQIATVLKTANKVGLLRVGFAVETDCLAAPIKQFGLSVQLVPEYEFGPLGKSSEVLRVGETGKLSHRISCRRLGTEGLGLPENVKAVGPIRAAALKGTVGETTQSGGIIETTEEIDIELLPSSKSGHRQGELLFQWPGGLARSHVITWEVRPFIKATPSGLVIKPSRQLLPVTVTIESEDRPIRIVKVDGPLAKPFPPSTEARRRHPLDLMVDTSKADRTGISDITITTDHPYQRDVAVAVLVSGSTEGTDP